MQLKYFVLRRQLRLSSPCQKGKLLPLCIVVVHTDVQRDKRKKNCIDTLIVNSNQCKVFCFLWLLVNMLSEKYAIKQDKYSTEMY